MKQLIILFVALSVAGYMFYNHTTSHPKYSIETQMYHKYIQETMVEKINSMNTSWTAGYNKKWETMGKDAIIGLMGVKQGPPPVKLRELEINVKDVPETFDPREEWPKCESIKEVRDQANCGSCWAFGMVEAASDRICVASKQEKQTRISSEDLLDCCDGCGMGCNGGFPSAAWDYWQDSGLCTGDLYGDDKWCKPYSMKPCDHHTTGKYGPCPDIGPTPPCQAKCNDSYKTEYKDDLKFATDAYSVPVKQIQTELMTNGPAECAFTVYEDFLTYKSGVYEHKTGAALGGHAVKMMGWGTENGVDYWLIANSWNEDWGDKGFFKIKRGNDECGIESQVVAGTPKL